MNIIISFFGNLREGRVGEEVCLDSTKPKYPSWTGEHNHDVVKPETTDVFRDKLCLIRSLLK
jgi:hypothetical protein